MSKGIYVIPWNFAFVVDLVHLRAHGLIWLAADPIAKSYR